MIYSDELKVLKMIANKARAGPWTAYLCDTLWRVDHGPPDDMSQRFDLFEDATKETCEFIAVAREAVPRLVKEVERLQAIVEDAVLRRNVKRAARLNLRINR